MLLLCDCGGGSDETRDDDDEEEDDVVGEDDGRVRSFGAMAMMVRKCSWFNSVAVVTYCYWSLLFRKSVVVG